MKARDDGELAKLSMLDEFARPFQLYRTLQKFCSASYHKNLKKLKNAFFKTEMFMKCLIYHICVSVNQLKMSKTEFLRQINIFLLYTRLSTIINHIKQSFCIFLLC